MRPGQLPPRFPDQALRSRSPARPSLFLPPFPGRLREGGGKYRAEKQPLDRTSARRTRHCEPWRSSRRRVRLATLAAARLRQPIVPAARPSAAVRPSTTVPEHLRGVLTERQVRCDCPVRCYCTWCLTRAACRPDQVGQAVKVFTEFDADSSGTIDMTELGYMLTVWKTAGRPCPRARALTVAGAAVWWAPTGAGAASRRGHACRPVRGG